MSVRNEINFVNFHIESRTIVYGGRGELSKYRRHHLRRPNFKPKNFSEDIAVIAAGSRLLPILFFTEVFSELKMPKRLAGG